MNAAPSPRCLVPVILAAALFLPPGCKDRGVRPDPHPAVDIQVPDTEGHLGPLDILDIRVYDEEDLSGLYRVDVDGTITFPFLGAVDASNQTPNSLAEELARLLGEGYLLNPSVTVFVKEYNSRHIFVWGWVQKPGSYPYVDGMTIVEAIARASGASEGGALNRTRVTRRVDGNEETFTVQVSKIANGNEPNVVLQPEDVIYVPQSPI